MFSEALNQVIGRLERAQKARLLRSYALIGGFAVSAWGVARATQDIDLAVALGPSEPQALAAYLEATYEPGDIDDPLRGVFRLTLACEGQSVPVQLILLPSKWMDIAFRGVETVKALGCSVPVVSWQALVLLKLYAGGPVDLQDARSIVAVRNPNVLEREDLLAQAEAVGLAHEMQALLNSTM
ncbi:MAG: hypothetical protein U0236_19145 [Nitrospira sp.]